MSLEDHVGDVLAKARGSLGLASAAAAAAAGLDADAYGRLEAEGVCSGPVRWVELGALLGLAGDRLQRMAAGWNPRQPDLATWRELRVVTTSQGMSVNCYLVWDEVTRDAALFDTGWEAGPILALVAQHGLVLRHVFVTHSHGDHVAALPAIRTEFPQVRLHTSASGAPVEQRNRANDFIHLGSLRITNRPTPGHTEDGTTYVVGNWPEDAPHVAIVGDALFAGSMGKAGAQLARARARVREAILSLPPDTLICPGHGPLTTVVEERANNPFFA
jgi:glyoxylase-like metal-dependent hydrolase (beta-lactamase superfamily II)